MALCQLSADLAAEGLEGGGIAFEFASKVAVSVGLLPGESRVRTSLE